MWRNIIINIILNTTVILDHEGNERKKESQLPIFLFINKKKWKIEDNIVTYHLIMLPEISLIINTCSD